MKCVRWIQGVLAARKVHLVPLLLCLNIKTLFMFVFVWASRPTKIMWTLQLHWPLWILRGCLIKVVGLWIRDRPWKCGRSAWFQLVYFACSSDQWMLPWVSFFAGCWPDVLQSFQFTLFCWKKIWNILFRLCTKWWYCWKTWHHFSKYSFFTVLCGYLRVELSLLSTVGEAMRVQGSKKKNLTGNTCYGAKM